MLGAFVLTRHHDPARQVGQPNRRVGFVDVLPPGSTGPVGINAQVFRPDLDFNGLINIRVDKDGRKGGMPPGIGIKR